MSQPPLTGSQPVQFGIAVSRNPATLAGMKPNNIPCTCQASGSNRIGKMDPFAHDAKPDRERRHGPHPVARKTDRNPMMKNTGPSLPRFRCIAVAETTPGISDRA